MGYSAEHIADTRRSIINSANTLFRKQGYHRTSINQIMDSANLTHGGFYAHFKSKEDLFCVAMADDLNFTKVVQRLCTDAKAKDKPSKIALAVRHYLDRDSVQSMGDACTAVALSAEVHRIGGRAQQGFTARFSDLVDEFETAIGDRQAALQALATSIGALTLARALSDDTLIEDLLASCINSVSADSNSVSSKPI